MNIAEWIQQGKELAGTLHRQPWAVADWILAGSQCGGIDSKYKTPASILNWKPAACRQAAYIARAFPPAERQDILTFGHHATVASLEPDERRRLLDECIDTAPSGIRTVCLTVAKLRARIRELNGVKPKEPKVLELKYDMLVRCDGVICRVTDICSHPKADPPRVTVTLAHADLVKIDDEPEEPIKTYKCDGEGCNANAREGSRFCGSCPDSLEIKAMGERNRVRAMSPDDFVPAGTVLETPPLFGEPEPTPKPEGWSKMRADEKLAAARAGGCAYCNTHKSARSCPVHGWPEKRSAASRTYASANDVKTPEHWEINPEETLKVVESFLEKHQDTSGEVLVEGIQAIMAGKEPPKPVSNRQKICDDYRARHPEAAGLSNTKVNKLAMTEETAPTEADAVACRAELDALQGVTA